MQTAPQELLKQYVQSQHFTSTAEIMAAMKEMFRDVIQQVMEVEMDEELGRERCSEQSGTPLLPITATGIRKRRSRLSWAKLTSRSPEIARAITSRKSLESMTAMPKAWRTRSSPCTPAA